MKNKKFTYFLGLLVLVVWGIIIYRIFKSVSTEEESYPVAEKKVAKEPFDDYSFPPDTTHLLLNYRDPFGLEKPRDTVQTKVKHIVSVKNNLPILKQGVNWTFIKYSGYVRNPGSKKLIAVVNINGKAFMLSEGETADQVKLIKNMLDSIKITYQGKTTYIKTL